MKKVIRNVFVLALTLILAFCGLTLMFTGCGEDGSASASGKVYSNGGTVVRYGDYVYFINGIPDYTDENGNTNVRGDVVKGGLYRAKIAENRPDPDAAENKEIAEIGEAEYNKTNDGLYDVLDFDYERRDYIQLGQYTIGSETESATYVDEQGRVPMVRQFRAPMQIERAIGAHLSRGIARHLLRGARPVVHAVRAQRGHRLPAAARPRPVIFEPGVRRIEHEHLGRERAQPPEAEERQLLRERVSPVNADGREPQLPLRLLLAQRGGRQRQRRPARRQNQQRGQLPQAAAQRSVAQNTHAV